MSENRFTDPDDTHDEWVDVRMQDPEEGEWDVDAVVAEGRVEYVDLRIRPDLLTPFIDCLIQDVGTDRARTILEQVADRNGIDTSDDPDGDVADGERSR